MTQRHRNTSGTRHVWHCFETAISRASSMSAKSTVAQTTVCFDSSTPQPGQCTVCGINQGRLPASTGHLHVAASARVLSNMRCSRERT